MSDPAIRVERVTKVFRTGQTARSLKTAVLDRLRGRPRPSFTALQDVSFSVQPGETLGVIGANGAGKSTLLATIAGTIIPTSGRVESRGVVSSLLELGAGFHPDLTGRENVYLYGAILGMPRRVMRRRFDAIVDFAGLAGFIDQPVRHYSSGMYVRLGFAVAVQVDPDILLVDEVLAVGDAEFQQRCLAKMAEFRRLGRTLLIISHDLHTIRSVSDRILLLDHGVVRGLGAPGDCIARYASRTLGERGRGAREWGTGEARIRAVLERGPGGRGGPHGEDGDRRVRVRIEYDCGRRIEQPTFGFAVSDADGRVVFGSNSELDAFPLDGIDGHGALRLDLDLGLLQAGSYLLSFSLHSRDHRQNYHRLENAITLQLGRQREFDGLVRLPCRWARG